MKQAMVSLTTVLALAGALLFATGAAAQTTPGTAATPTPDNAVMVTIFLKHDQSRPLGELNAQLDRQGFYKAFPPWMTPFTPSSTPPAPIPCPVARCGSSGCGGCAA